ncbi:phage head-tail adapter protein [Vagococcus entomophilus]|uniref:Phage head-tail adapter protein n=1 Tax=Vagococcus entomophilus TaxID=1160095 RepID=A0A430AK20_9ENTE|nr:phage head-tail adapter protein [Vagococcus entomophilus]RSU08435.1 phage head-tail adapter protein [Vagococcus entomophilus]
MGKPSFEYKPPKVQTGSLRTPVSFYRYKPHSGPEPGEEEKEILHICYAEIYNPSMKDREILNSIETTNAVTINIRDTKGEYSPTNKHYVEIDDYRYKNVRWDVLDVRNDFENNAFITVLLGVVHDD